MADQARKSRQELAANLLASSGTGVANVCLTNPINTLKVRWQVQSQLSLDASLLSFSRQILVKEGLWAGLWAPGLLPGLIGSVASIGMRYGTYPLVRDSFAWAAGKSGAANMFAAGLTSGMVGYFLASPFLMIMVRMQSEAGLVGHDGKFVTGARVGSPPAYPGTLHALRTIAGGSPGTVSAIHALWHGSSVITLRGGVLNGSQMMAYDWTKTQLKDGSSLSDGPSLHVLASLVAAVSATTCSMPVDVVLTFYQSSQNAGGSRQERYGSKGPLSCARAMLEDSGPMIFMRGWLPNFARLAPTCIFSMWLYEQLRLLAGIGYLD